MTFGETDPSEIHGGASAPAAPGNQVTFAAGSQVQFQTAQAMTVHKQVAVASGGD